MRKEGQCRYIVEWSTVYACPKRGLSAGWILISLLIFGFTVYTIIGCAYNHVQLGYRLGWEALPHSLFWRNLPGLVADGLRYTADVLTEWGGGIQRAKEKAHPIGATYGKVENVDYEWS